MRTRARLAAVLATVAVAGVLAAPAQGEPAAAIVPGNILWTFDTSSPGTVTQRLVTGLGANETIRGIDVWPANGRVYIGTVTPTTSAPPSAPRH